MVTCEEYFDKIADNWSKNESNDKASLASFLSFLPIKEGDKVLDVACGTGKISEVLYDMSHTKVKAIDVSSKMISHALEKRDLSKVDFEVKDFYNNKDKYNVIVIFNAFPHLTDIPTLARVAYDSLEDNGYFVICHDMSRQELDHHHEFVPYEVSRSLTHPQSEYQSFVRYFKAIKLEDTDHSFIMVMQKN